MKHSISSTPSLRKQFQLIFVTLRKQQYGFTLIEILLVVSIIAILSVSTGIAFSSINAKQQLNNSAQDVLVMLHSAKAKAQSQITLTACNSLQQYQVMRCGAGPLCKTVGASSSTYELQAVCNNGSYLIDAKSLLGSVTFANTSDTTISFSVLTGGSSGGVFTVTSGSGNRILTVSQYGQVSLTEN